MNPKLKNWAGNYEYSTNSIHYPETIEQVQQLVAQCDKLRVLGTRHSFNSIADSDANLISLQRLAPEISVNHQQSTVTITGNVTYGQLCPVLHREGFALHNLASLPHVTVAGACATGTHGSGVRNRNLASVVSSVEIVTADGEIVRLSRESEGFAGAVVSLGGLGVVVRLTLDVVPTYEMRQEVYLNLPASALEAHFDAVMSGAYSVSLFTEWHHDRINQVWLKKRIQDHDSAALKPEFFGALAADKPIHPIAGLPPEECTGQLGIVGHWHERLTHFRIEATPSAGDELQSEYFVARSHAAAAFRAIATLGDQIRPHLMVSEIRTIAADDLWISPYYHQDTAAFHFTWKPHWPEVRALLPEIESQLAPFNPRPHWGKLFTLAPDTVQSHYERLPDFQQMLHQYDAQGKFRNAFVNEMIGLR